MIGKRSKTPHAVRPLPADVGSEQRAKAAPPQAHGLVAKVDTALEEQVLDVAQRQWETHVHQNHQPDHGRRRVEIAERPSWMARTWHVAILRSKERVRQPVRLF